MGSTTVYVVYGAEELPYRRMIYGSDSQIGLTPGTFYDLRTTVVPYYPNTKTEFKIVFDEEYRNQTHYVTVEREEPANEQLQSSFQLFPQTSQNLESSFSTQLSRGLNTFTIRADNRVVYMFSVTATNYGKFIRAYAEAIQSNIWDPVDTLVSSLYSSSATRLLDVYFGDIMKLLPEEENLTRFAQQLLASSLVEHAGTETGVVLMASALFQHTVGIEDIITKSDLRNLWLYPILPRGSRYDKRMLVWSLTSRQGRRGSFAQLQLNHGESVEQNDLVTLVNGEPHFMQDGSSTEEYAERSWAELSMTVDQTMCVDFGNRVRSVVLFPGLWDQGESPWLDQGVEFDNGNWDGGDTSGDPDKSYFIGIPTVPGSLGNMLGVGLSVLGRSVSEYSVVVGVTAELIIE